MTQEQIAAAVGLSQSFISDLGTGKRGDLLYHDGVRLMRLWERHCKRRSQNQPAAGR